MLAFARHTPLAILLLTTEVALLKPAGAAETYLNIPSIPGEDPTPGYPGAMAASSVTITPNSFSITKSIDSASPSLLLAVAGGDPLGTANMLFYNTAPAGPPDATLDFFSTFATSYQSLDAFTEEVGFSAANPLELYLEVPGIPGESNTPGHPNVMQIQSWSLFSNDFTIIKLQDSASDDLLVANAIGDHFPIARLLLYDSLPLAASPDAVIEFHDLLISSSQQGVGPGQPEEHTFNFASLSQPIPEPASLVLMAAAAAIVMFTARSINLRPVKFR